MKKLFLLSKPILALMLLVAFAGLSWGQAKIVNNEAIEGRINKIGESQEWTVELPEDGTIDFSVRSRAFKMVAFLYRDNQPIVLFPINNLGGRTFSYGVGGDTEIRCKPQKELPRGKYRIQVRSVRDNELGAYEIQVNEPTFDSPKVDKVIPKRQADEQGSDESKEEITIQEYFERLESKLLELEKRVIALEKRKF
jgi:hypothetical protein